MAFAPNFLLDLLSSRQKGWHTRMNANLTKLGKLFCEDNDGNFWIVRNAIYDPSTNSWSQESAIEPSFGMKFGVDTKTSFVKCETGASPFEWNYIDVVGSFPDIDLNLQILAFQAAVAGDLALYDMEDGIMDQLEDQTGIGSSSLATYNSDGDYYTSFHPNSLIQLFSGSPISGTNAWTDLPVAFDGIISAGAISADGYATSGVSWIGYDLGEGNSSEVMGFGLSQHPSDHGITSVILQYSDNGSSWSSHQTFSVTKGATLQQYYVGTCPSSHRYWRLLANANTISGGYNGWIVYELKLYGTVDMTITSVSFTADTDPELIRIVVMDEEVDVCMPNTDVQAEVSRDGGTTWTSVTLEKVGEYGTDKYILAGTADVTDQPSGTSVKWRVSIMNEKYVKVHGVGMLWQ